MIIGSSPLSPGDLDVLATLHVNSMPDSLISFLGHTYTRRFYRYIADTPQERLIIERGEGGRIVGGSVITFEPVSLPSRLLVNTHPWLYLPTAFFRLPVLAILKGLLNPAHRVETVLGLPEFLIMFTDPALRGAGIGVRLFAAVEAAIEESGQPLYFLKTGCEPGNKAFAYHKRNGFVPVGEAVHFGVRFAYMTKTLDPKDGAAPR